METIELRGSDTHYLGTLLEAQKYGEAQEFVEKYYGVDSKQYHFVQDNDDSGNVITGRLVPIDFGTQGVQSGGVETDTAAKDASEVIEPEGTAGAEVTTDEKTVPVSEESVPTVLEKDAADVSLESAQTFPETDTAE